MKNFSKSEIISIIVIFVILVAVSIPNFKISIRRARDQVRRDDMGALTHALADYVSDYSLFPLSSPDGKIVYCLKPGESPVKDKKGNLINLIPCNWGTDTFTNLLNGKVYLTLMPRDPDYQKGASYLYFSDGKRYQIFAAMEGLDEAEIDPKIIARNLACGSRVCNIGRSYSVPIDMSIEEYDKLNLDKNAQTQK